jgi:hypothetical protein
MTSSLRSLFALTAAPQSKSSEPPTFDVRERNSHYHKKQRKIPLSFPNPQLSTITDPLRKMTATSGPSHAKVHANELPGMGLAPLVLPAYTEPATAAKLTDDGILRSSVAPPLVSARVQKRGKKKRNVRNDDDGYDDDGNDDNTDSWSVIMIILSIAVGVVVFQSAAKK